MSPDYQGTGNRVPTAIDDEPPQKGAGNRPIGRVQCDQRLGGLLKSYRRAA